MRQWVIEDDGVHDLGQIVEGPLIGAGERVTVVLLADFEAAEHHRELLMQALVEVLNYDQGAAEAMQAERRAGSVLDAVLGELAEDEG